MPYPNNNPYNIVIAQTTGSVVSGQYPFTERIISGSNLFIVTDANGLLTASSVSPTSETASYLTPTNNYTVNQLTASSISSSNSLSASNVWFGNSMTYTETMATGSLTSPDLNFISTATTGSDVMFNISATALTGSAVALLINATGSQPSYAISASNGIIIGTIITGSDVKFNNLTVTGNIIGSIQTSSVALSSSISVINDNSTYYVTFVDATSGSRALKTDADILSYNPALNRVILGNTSGSLIISNDNGTNPNYIYLSSEQNAAGGIAQLQVGNPTSNTTASFVVGQSQFIVATGQPSTGVFTSLVTNITNATDNNGLTYNNGALIVDGGVGIGKNLFVDDNLYVQGSTFLYGDLTIYGTGSIVNISSSTVIIGDNRIQLNAGTPIQRYAGIDVFDSGSGTFTNNVTSSLLWDGLNDNWLLVSANSSSTAPLTQSSAIIIGGPSGSFGNESLLTVNYIPKVQSTGKNLQNSSLIDDGVNLIYSGTSISASNISASNLTVQYTGSITYATGVYITYTTGSFTTLTITTGSSPGVGAQVPTNPTASGMAGQINVDNNFIYVYTNQIWKRVPLSTWLL